MRKLNTTCTGVLLAAGMLTSSAVAAPVWLQDYEAGLTDPFDVPPDYSGTTQGVGAGDTITHVADDGARTTSASAELFIPWVDQATDTGRSWQVRLLPNISGARTATNFEFNPDGFVGYYLKVDPSVTAQMTTAPVLEDPGTGTATGAVQKNIIKDGQWHLYEWNMDDATQWVHTFNIAPNGIYGNVPAGSQGTFGDTTLSGTQSFDSIAIFSDTDADATIRIDQIGFNNEGTLAIPEPTSLALLGLGAAGLLGRRRRA